MKTHEKLAEEARARVAACQDLTALRGVEREYVGKDGLVGRLLAAIPSLPADQRPQAGRAANELKRALAAAIEERSAELADAALESERAAEGFDPSLPPARTRRGSLHPVTAVGRRVEDLFQSMGYALLDGPEVELDHYNFETLNFPPDHPAREEYDTFWCDHQGRLLLRTHTSPVQIRAMERLDPPIRAIVPGRVFRNEHQDASHDHTFHQVEGLVVDEGICVGHLTGTLRTFLREFFQADLDVRLRPGYFPFVEPGFEFDVRCPFCSDGCRVCKKSGWIEFCGCGMVHPNVLRAGDIDPERYTGFAFGFGLDRLTMMHLGIDDIRHFMGGDLRFLEQF